MYALAVLYLQQEQFNQAGPYVRKLREYYPDDRTVRELEMLLEEKGEGI
jgi:hypothetical protein